MKKLKAPTRGQEVTLLIDSDYWTYMMAALCEHKTVQPEKKTTPVESNDMIVHIEPVEHLHYLIHHAITDLKDRFMTNDIEVYLTGDGNFREQIAVTKPYKGQRTKGKPHYYQEVRDYLISEYGAVVIDDQEADDVVAIRQMDCMREGKASVIVSPDKDLKCMFGYLYNPRTKVLDHILPHEAAAHFYKQMIIGDSVDNIPGCKGRGEKYWKDLVQIQPFVADLKDIRQTAGFVAWWRDEVDFAYSQKGLPYEYLLEQGQLLHMRRHKNEMWQPMYDWFTGFNDLRPVMMIEDEDDE